MTLPAFGDLKLGSIEASDEARDYPELLLDGFYDHRSAASLVESGRAYLLLGVKGAGKSAVLEHLRLKYQPRADVFFDQWDLSGFPVADVRNVKTGQLPGLGRTQNSWELILLLRLIESLNRDNSITRSGEFGKLWKDLQRLGLVHDNWKTRVIEWSKATAKLPVPKVMAEVGVEVGRNSIQLFQLVELIKTVLTNASVMNRHIVALDGLDLLFFESENKWESLSGLVQALRSLNLWAIEPARLPVTFLSCLRSDMFNILPSSETNKYSAKSVTLDWARRGSESDELWNLIDGKVNVHHAGVKLRSDYLTETVQAGSYHAPAARFILEHTRLFPRDLVAVLTYIQIAARESGAVDGPLPGSVVKDGVETYCNQYFEGELFNNLAGVLPREQASGQKVAYFKGALQTLPRRTFTYAFLVDELDGLLNAEEVTALLKQLFEVGGIGTRTSNGRGGATEFTYRRPGGAGFTRRNQFILHNALTRAWHVLWS